MLKKLRNFTVVARRRWKITLPAVILVVLLIGLIAFLSGRDSGQEETVSEVLPKVEAKTVRELMEAGDLKKVGVIEPLESAMLVARSGGRVTAVGAQLGGMVAAGQIVVEIDGGVEANPTQVQARVAGESLQAFEAVSNQARRSADNAVAVAQLVLTAAEEGKGLTIETALKQRQVADNAARQAQFSLEDARETGNDVMVRTADLALQAAQLAQDQATLAREMASQQSSDGLKQAAQNLEGTRIARDKIATDLFSQKVALGGQLAVAREQFRLAQVTAPLAGLVTALDVKVGDFVQPGTRVGEINALTGAQVTLEVGEAIRRQLEVGLVARLEAGGQEFNGEIIGLSNAPESTTGLWQVDLLIKDAPVAVHAGDLVEVNLPVRGSLTGDVLLPLDAVIARQEGVAVFRLEDGVAREQLVSVRGYAGDLVEVNLGTVTADTVIVVSGNRRLKDGDPVAL